MLGGLPGVRSAWTLRESLAPPSSLSRSAADPRSHARATTPAPSSLSYEFTFDVLNESRAHTF